MSVHAIATTHAPEVEQWATDGVVIWRKPGGPTVCAVLATSLEERAYLSRLVCAAPQLLQMLDECATRLERCVLHDGSAPEYAALAVARYRDLIRSVRP